MKKLFTLYLVFIFSGCGTETGNPLEDLNLVDGASSSMNNLKTSICLKLSSCYSGINISDCKEAIDETDGFDVKFGLNASEYDNYRDITMAVVDGDLFLNSAHESACWADIVSLSCSDSEVVAAYSSSSPGNFSNTPQIIPSGGGSCNELFNNY